MDILQIINKKIEDIAKIDSCEFNDGTHLVAEYIINSIGIINLVLELENEFDICFDEDDMLGDEVLTPKGLCLIVCKKLKKC